LTDELAGLDRLSDVITEFESCRSLGFERTHHRDRCSQPLRDLFDRGLRHSFETALDARRKAEATRLRFDTLFEGFDCLVTPSTPGEALAGLGDTGSAIFNKIWNLLHMPAVNVPAGRAANGLPFGLQVVAPRYRDGLALAGAERLRQALAEAGQLFL
jgi:Asp-tRNA(Asn)/Glu-tRNA(Gln) amidotransferase A subunit family amidase